MRRRNRECRKCKAIIPTRIIIDGKARFLVNRRFCLKCSPFGCHNTKPDDPDRKVYKKSNYKTWSKERKVLHTARIYKKGLDRKLELIKIHGGKCIKCGYCNCYRAMSFHHREPLEKKFHLNIIEIKSKPWDIVLEESKKCDLLCLNCHAEEEYKKSEVNDRTYKDIIERYEKWGVWDSNPQPSN